MTTFPLLADPRTYWPHTLRLEDDPKARDYWITVFEDHLVTLVPRCHEVIGDDAEAQQRVESMRAKFHGQLQTLRREPEAFGPISVLSICRLRDAALREIGVPDPYKPVKDSENDAALKLLPAVLAELDAHDDGDRLETIIRGVFAGNVFDLGARSTTKLFENEGFNFLETRDGVTPRPWLIDDFDALAQRWMAKPHRKAIVFVDNAGADVVLGMVPLCREMLRRGTEVIITANTLPALNDITIDELPDLMRRIAALDDVTADAIKSGQLSWVASGNDAPLIDLREVGDALAAACAGVDLVVLEGMGRAVESNLYAAFSCDAVKLATIKEGHLAEMLGGKLYDVVCKFDAVGNGGGVGIGQ